MNTELHLNGALGKNMMPQFPTLSGKGVFETQQVAIKNFPPLEKMFDVTKLSLLNNPTMQALKGAFQIHDGRLFTQPFAVKLGPTTLNVSGSNGFDQSMLYNLQLQVPRSELGGAANQAIGGIISKAGQAGVNLAAAPMIPLGIQVGGSVTNPTVKADVGSLTSNVAQGAQQAVKEAVTQKVDSAALRLVAEAEQKAAGIRQEGESLAAKVKRKGTSKPTRSRRKRRVRSRRWRPSPPRISCGNSRTRRPRISSVRRTSGRTRWSPRRSVRRASRPGSDLMKLLGKRPPK